MAWISLKGVKQLSGFFLIRAGVTRYNQRNGERFCDCGDCSDCGRDSFCLEIVCAKAWRCNAIEKKRQSNKQAFTKQH
jgi:hypothetical protein